MSIPILPRGRYVAKRRHRTITSAQRHAAAIVALTVVVIALLASLTIVVAKIAGA